ncbi:MAG: hypothetical protein IPK60_09065 [Sandaracinaceae bacterium]|nr:hypothetical protein [Sandaracinaceae bacterium]
MARAISGEVFDENAVDAVFTRHDDALVKVRVVFKSALGRVHDALTPDQRKELASLLGKFEADPAWAPIACSRFKKNGLSRRNHVWTKNRSRFVGARCCARLWIGVRAHGAARRSLSCRPFPIAQSRVDE